MERPGQYMNAKSRVFESVKNYIKAFAIPLALYLVLLLLIRERIGSWKAIVTILVLTVVPTIAAYGEKLNVPSGKIHLIIDTDAKK